MLNDNTLLFAFAARNIGNLLKQLGTAYDSLC